MLSDNRKSCCPTEWLFYCYMIYDRIISAGYDNIYNRYYNM